jgi:hypothetical protein
MNTSNSVAEKQNRADALDLLAAASHFYGYGKTILTVQVALTVGVSVAAAFLTLFYPNFKTWAVPIGATVTWLDVVFIDRVQIYFRKRGALLQEQLDTRLFEIPWNELRAGKAVEPEDIHHAASKFLDAKGDKMLRDWYPSNLSSIPLSTFTVICQRSCLSWDAGQRLVYGYWLTGLVAGMIIVLWVVAFARGMSVPNFAASVYAPVAPAIIWAARELRRQRDAADSLKKAQGFLEGIWKRMARREISEADLAVATRQIQDSIFDSRSKNPFIFNWFYMWFRSGRETAMRKTAEQLASEIHPDLRSRSSTM